MTVIESMGKNAKQAARTLLNAGSLKNKALNAIADALVANADKIVEANNIDLEKIRDISEVKIDQSKSSIERILDFLSQGFNPYLYKIGDSLVEISYSPVGASADTCIMDVFKDIYR